MVSQGHRMRPSFKREKETESELKQGAHLPGSRPSSRSSSGTTCTNMAKSRKRRAEVRQTARSPPSLALKYSRVTMRNTLLEVGLRKPRTDEGRDNSGRTDLGHLEFTFGVWDQVSWGAGVWLEVA